MKVKLLGLSYDELKARRDALAAMIAEPLRDVTMTILILDSRIPALGELDEALEVLKRARRLEP